MFRFAYLTKWHAGRSSTDHGAGSDGDDHRGIRALALCADHIRVN